MAFSYNRRRPSLVRNFWVYRRLVLLALVLGLILWFVWANNAPVTVAFPFRLGTFQSTTGLVILLSVLVGSVVTALSMTLVRALRRVQRGGSSAESPASSALDQERPPADYGAKTSEGFSDTRWS
jgi:uncharacterized integral membrane protein